MELALWCRGIVASDENNIEDSNRVPSRRPGRNDHDATYDYQSPSTGESFVATAGRATDRAIGPDCRGEGAACKTDCGATDGSGPVARAAVIERSASAAGRSGPHAS